MTPVDEPERARTDGLEELEHEAALADAGNPHERDELWRALREHARERLPEKRQLPLAPDELGPADTLDADARPCPQRHSRPAPVPTCPSPRPRSRVLELDDPLGRAVGRLVDEDRARRRGGLETGGGVHDVARRHAFARIGSRVQRDQRLAGRDPDPDLQVALLRERLPDRERGSDGSLRVVLVGDRSAEDRHDRVTDELLDGAAEALELGAHARVVRLEQAPHVLRVHGLGSGREADEVAEEAGDDLALLPRRPGAVASDAPHSEQNFAFSAFSDPQAGQIMRSWRGALRPPGCNGSRRRSARRSATAAAAHLPRQRDPLP